MNVQFYLYRPLVDDLLDISCLVALAVDGDRDDVDSACRVRCINSAGCDAATRTSCRYVSLLYALSAGCHSIDLISDIKVVDASVISLSKSKVFAKVVSR